MMLTRLLSASNEATSEQAGVAFAITFLAGLATGMGGALVYAPNLANFNPTVLSGGLGLAAGSLLCIALLDLFPESKEFFESAASSEESKKLATLWTALCFFGGILLMYCVSRASRILTSERKSQGSVADIDTCKAQEQEEEGTTSGADKLREEHQDMESAPANKNITIHKGDDESQSSATDETTISNPKISPLLQAGVTTGIALSLHNIPEGIVTYIAATKDPTIGALLAVGIAFHNIPEGVSVALPLYNATGKR
jgi:ZIP family zinc transporter